ncbi:MAG: hypothetical protein ACRDJ9_16050, partial [Dehalococcoidia bacterium]
MGAGALAAGTAFLAACGGGDEEERPTGAAAGSPTTGVTGPAGGQPKSGGVFRTDMIAEDPAHFDMHQGASFGITEPFTIAYDQLVQFSNTDLGAIVPNLASAWETPDTTQLTFKLAEATFHDDTPFT